MSRIRESLSSGNVAFIQGARPQTVRMRLGRLGAFAFYRAGYKDGIGGTYVWLPR